MVAILLHNAWSYLNKPFHMRSNDIETNPIMSELASKFKSYDN